MIQWFIRSLLPLVLIVLPQFCLADGIRSATLDNGITYYIWPDAHVKGISLRLVVPVGSIHEQENERGVAHFIEHLLFRGTRSYSESAIKEFLHSIHAIIGPDANAYTTFDHTLFMLNLPTAEPTALVTALHLMSEWLDAPRFDHRDVEAERGIVMEEWRKGLSLHDELQQQILPLILGSHYGNRMPIGVPEVVSRISTKAIRRFYDCWYRQAPAAIVLTGEIVDADAAEQLVCELFGQVAGLRSWEAVTRTPTIEVPETIRTGIFESPAFGHTSIELIWHKPIHRVVDLGDYRQRMVQALFFSMFNARLERLQETANLDFEASAVPVELSMSMQYEIITAKCHAEQVQPVLSAVVTELHRAQRQGFSPQERKLAENLLRYQMELINDPDDGLSTSEMAELCTNHFLGRTLLAADSPLLIDELLGQIDLEEINEFARSLDLLHGSTVLIASNRPLAKLGIDESCVRAVIELSVIGDEDEILVPERHFCPAHLMTRPDLPGSIVEERPMHSLGLMTWVLENGMRVHVLPRPGCTKKVTLKASASGGIAGLPLDLVPAGYLAEGLLRRSGLGPYSPYILSQIEGSETISFSRSIKSLTREVHARCKRDELEALFQLLHLVFSDQTLPPAAFESQRRQTLELLEQEAVNPDVASAARAQRIATCENLFVNLPDQQSIEHVQYSDCAAIASSAFANPADFDLFLIGDLNLDEVRDLVCTYLAPLNATDSLFLPTCHLEVSFPEIPWIETLQMGSTPRSRVEIIFPASLSGQDPDGLEAARRACMIVRKRLRELLRDRLSATYGVSASLHALYPDATTGRLFVSFHCDPVDAQVLSAMALRELRQLVQYGPYEDEMALIKEKKTRMADMQFRDNEFWADFLRQSMDHGWEITPEAVERRLTRCPTAEEVHEQLKAMLNLNRYVLLISRPVDADSSTPKEMIAP